MPRIAAIVMKWREVDVINPDDGSVERRRAMVPIEKYRRHADRQYEDQADYPLIPMEPRNRAHHSAYFAQLKVAYDSLPENVSARWETVEHFRKWVLIETSWYYEKEFTFEGRNAEKEARMLGAFIRTEDEHSRVYISRTDEDEESDAREQALDAAVTVWEEVTGEITVREHLRLAIRAALVVLNRRGGKWKVIVRKAMSQDYAHMARQEFKDSADDVLAYATDLIGTTRPVLRLARSA